MSLVTVLDIQWEAVWDNLPGGGGGVWLQEVDCASLRPQCCFQADESFPG